MELNALSFVGSLVAVMSMILGMMLALHNNLSKRLDHRIQESEARTAALIQESEARTAALIQSLEARTDRQFAELKQDIGEVEARSDRQFGELKQEIGEVKVSSDRQFGEVRVAIQRVDDKVSDTRERVIHLEAKAGVEPPPSPTPASDLSSSPSEPAPGLSSPTPSPSSPTPSPSSPPTEPSEVRSTDKPLAMSPPEAVKISPPA